MFVWRNSIRNPLLTGLWLPRVLLRAAVFFSAIVVFMPQAHADQTSTRKVLDLSVGKGFVGRKIQHRLIFKQVHGVNWVEAKLRFLDGVPQMQAIGLQFGTQQTEEITKGTLCRTAPSIAGRIYCSTAESELNSGPQYTALYGGIQVELIELTTLEPRPLRAYVGAGMSRLQSTLMPSNVAPYASFEVLYESKKQFTAKAGLYVSPTEDTETLGVAMPAVSVSYFF